MVIQGRLLSGRPLDAPKLPEGWCYKSLASLVNDRGISYGVVQPGSAVSGGVPVLRVNNIRGGRIIADDVLCIDQQIEAKYRRTRLRGGEILLTLVGSLGECAVVPEELAGWNVARAVGVIPLKPEVDPDWVAYCLRSAPLQRYIREWATTTVQATLNLRDVGNLPIPVPPREEREEIVKILGNLDKKAAVSRRMNRTLEAMARAVFKSWFVDFDPVRSAEGSRPSGWGVGALGDLAENQRRSIEPGEVTEETPYIGLEHMPRKSIALGEWGTPEDLASSKLQFRRGEILFGKLRPYFHKVGVAVVDGICSTDIVVIAPKTPSFFGPVLGYITSDEFVGYADRSSVGTKMPRARWADMARYPVLVPPEPVAQAFTDQVKPLVDMIATNVLQSRTLAALRDALLPKLLSGEIRVKEAEKIVGEVV